MKKILGFFRLFGFLVFGLCVVTAMLDPRTKTSGPGDPYDILGGIGLVVGIVSAGIGLLVKASAKRPTPKTDDDD